MHPVLWGRMGLPQPRRGARLGQVAGVQIRPSLHGGMEGFCLRGQLTRAPSGQAQNMTETTLAGTSRGGEGWRRHGAVLGPGG